MSDIERTEKDIQKNNEPLKMAKDIDIFNHDVLLIYLFKKTERLSSAVYLLTSVLSEVEPLRTTLRARSIEMISNVGELSVEMVGETTLHKILRLIGETLSLLSVGVSARMLGDANVSVLEEEYRKLAKLLIDRLPERVGGARLESSFFEVGGVPDPGLYSRKLSAPYFSQVSVRSNSAAQSRAGVVVSRTDLSPSQGPLRDLKPQNNDRQTEILSVIATKGKVTIRDVALVIKDCSEKTIQRELATLVSGGVLKREGERRWSTYSKA